MKTYSLRELLPHVSPALLTYQEWVNVGMVMRDEGMADADYEAWSAADPRYKPGEPTRKWRSFRGRAGGVTTGTVALYARRQGWEGEQARGSSLDWDAEIQDEDVIVDKNWLEEKAVEEPGDDAWDPKAEMLRYLDALFDSTDLVGYVTETWDSDGRKSPTRGNYDRTAGQLAAALKKARSIEDVIGTVQPDVGAWVRFNPLDGKGVSNANVTDFRYALVESDSMPMPKQYAMFQELNLPIRILVSSGGKSLHAIVSIDAGSMDEYRKRVDYLYTVCRKNGLDIDQSNRNPSRLSRLPGVKRNGRKQFIVAENLGAGSFQQWQEWVESVSDELPAFEAIEDIADDLPPLDPPLIDGILRQGHKMLLAGPSKAGKSFAMLEMAIAIATGSPWMGFPCARGRVLYVNLELRDNSCKHRIYDVCRAMGVDTRLKGNLVVWNLRGRAEPLDKLAPKLIRRAAKERFLAIIIDPIYKVLTGDENNAEQMSRFCGCFDRICTELGTAVIYCHHHSKGAQGGKKSMDRASGSGVFARDPDAQIDMIELELTESVRAFRRDEAAKAAMRRALSAAVPDWAERIPLDDQLSRLKMELAAGTLLDNGTGARYETMLRDIHEAEAQADSQSAWRLEMTLREFPKPRDINCWFVYPTHVMDESGILADMSAEAELPPWKRGNLKTNAKKKAKAVDKVKEFAEVVESGKACAGGPPTLKEVAEYMNAPYTTVNRWMKQAGFHIDKNTGKVLKGNES